MSNQNFIAGLAAMKILNATFHPSQHYHHQRHEHHHHRHNDHQDAHHHHRSQGNCTGISFIYEQNMTLPDFQRSLNGSSWSSSSSSSSPSWSEHLNASSTAVTKMTETLVQFLSTPAMSDGRSGSIGSGNRSLHSGGITSASMLSDLLATTTNAPFMDGQTSPSNMSAATHVSSTFADDIKKTWYPILVPLMILFCALSFVINLLIVFSVRWCRKPLTPTLYFSISLALADAFASVVIGLGLLVNSLLPIYKYRLESHCFILTLEAFRLGGVVVTVTHLMALAINHWIGIVRPLQYEATMTRGTAFKVIVISWISPILVILLYFSSVKGQGFQSDNCDNCDFMKKITFRVIFASFFFAPLAIMTFIYWHIFIIVRSHLHYREKYREKYQSCQQLRRNVKAVVTTVLILGTYIVGWMPAILWFILVCDDCTYELHEVPIEIRIPVNMVINTLIIMKAVVDPIIYAARMADIQSALRKMRYDFFLWIFESCAPPRPPPLDTLEMGSVRFTKSFRMSSRGSSSRSNV